MEFKTFLHTVRKLYCCDSANNIPDYTSAKKRVTYGVTNLNAHRRYCCGSNLRMYVLDLLRFSYNGSVNHRYLSSVDHFFEGQAAETTIRKQYIKLIVALSLDNPRAIFPV